MVLEVQQEQAQQPLDNPDPDAVAEIIDSPWVLVRFNILFQLIGAIALYSLVKWRTLYNAEAYLALHPVDWPTIKPWLGLALGYIFAVQIFLIGYFSIFGPPDYSDPFEGVGFDLVYLALVLLVAPIFEEGMFRGFLFEGLRKTQLGDLGALALPTVFWAGMHFAYLPVPIFYPVLLAFGAILCLARLRTGSLIAPIILHSLFNFVQVVLSSF